MVVRRNYSSGRPVAREDDLARHALGRRRLRAPRVAHHGGEDVRGLGHSRRRRGRGLFPRVLGLVYLLPLLGWLRVEVWLIRPRLRGLPLVRQDPRFLVRQDPRLRATTYLLVSNASMLVR